MTDVVRTSNAKSFQRRVLDWMMETFSMEVTRDTTERNHRYLEESLELVQAMGCTQSEAHQLVDYVYGRPVGEPQQEVGGALVTLAALCSAADFDMTECGDRELARCWQNIDRIRAKQAGKPKHSPLPEHAPETGEVRDWRGILDLPRVRIIGTGGMSSEKKYAYIAIEMWTEHDEITIQKTRDTLEKFFAKAALAPTQKAGEHLYMPVSSGNDACQICDKPKRECSAVNGSGDAP
jgi:hypothetical protein